MEKENVKDVFLRYGVLLGKRNTEKQKVDFLKAAQRQLERAGFPMGITCVPASLMRQESINMYNLYAGDFKKVDVVFTTYYGMPLWQFHPKEWKVFDANWSRGNFLFHTLLFLCCMITVAAFLYVIVVPSLRKHGLVSLWGAALVLACSFGLYGIRRVRGGIVAGNVMVRDSSGLTVLFALACDLPEQGKQHVVFAMIDEGARSEYGLRVLQGYIGKKRIQRAYLDSIRNVEKLQGFADRHILEGPHGKLTGHAEWYDLTGDKRARGDILLTSGNCDNGCVSLKIEKWTDNSDLEQ